MAGSDSDEVEHGNPMLSWYDRTRPMWIDLVGDYAGKELFLIEGDSLLRECFEDERIDFEGNHPTMFAYYPAIGLFFQSKPVCTSAFQYCTRCLLGGGFERTRTSTNRVP